MDDQACRYSRSPDFSTELFGFPGFSLLSQDPRVVVQNSGHVVSF
jgi:hypothetical protein